MGKDLSIVGTVECDPLRIKKIMIFLNGRVGN